MDKRVGSSAGLLALLAVVLHTYNGDDKPGNMAASKKETAASASAVRPAPRVLGSEGPWRATQEYFHQEPGPQAASACGEYLLPSPGVKSRSECGRAALASLYALPPDFSPQHLSTLLATVPDPLHTRMSVETDRYLDALQQAAYRSGWELASQWLPWTLKANAAPSSSPSHLGVREVDVEMLPGLLVFRRHFVPNTDQSALLMIYIVGETPTTGINGYEFDVARRSMWKLGSDQPNRFAMVGPNFSGSLASLTSLLEADSHPMYYDIRAGSISNSHYVETMLNQLAVAGFSLGAPSPGKRSVSFHGSTLPSSAFEEHFHRLIDAWGYSDAQVAELTEDETGFAYQSATTQVAGPHSGIITYRYPRDVAQLRNAYSDIAFTADQKQDSRTNSGPELSLKDTQAGEDIFPVFSSTHTPVSQNAILDQIVRHLRSKSIRLVSLSATNVFDTIFLAKVIARYSPDTRILINGADLLFVQEAGQGSLTGLMAISPFPMFPDGNAWLRGKTANDVTTFADTDSIGEFNAALSLLHGEASPALLGQPLGPPLQSNRPDDLSAWLLVLGRYGWSPIKLLPQANPLLHIEPTRASASPLTDARFTNTWFTSTWFDPANRSTRLASERPLPAAPFAWSVLCVLISAAVIAFCARLFYLNSNRHLLVWSVLCLDDLPQRNQAIAQIIHFRYVCLFSCLATLSFIGGLLAAPLLAARYVYSSPVTTDGILEFLTLTAFLLPLCMALYLLIRVPLRLLKPPHDNQVHLSTPVYWLSGVLRAVAILFPVGGVVAWWFLCSNGVDGWLLCYRAFSLATPVSPILPLLFASGALFALAFFHLRRFTWADRQQPVLETAMFDETLWGQFSDLKLRLESVLFSPATTITKRSFPVLALSIFAGILLVTLLVPSECLRSFESPIFEALLVCMLLPLSVFATLTLVQFANCWSIFHAFLVTLNSLVLGRSFTRLPDFNGSGPVWIREVKLMSLASAVNSCIALHNLQQALPPLRTCRDRYWAALTRFLSTQHCKGGRRDFIQNYAAFRRTGADIADFLSRNILRPYWASHALPFLEDPVVETSAATKENADLSAGSSAARSASLTLPAELSQHEEFRAAAAAATGVSPSTLTVSAVAIPLPATTSSSPELSGASISSETYQLASKYVALQFSSFIGYALRHLQNMLLCCSVCFILSVLALNSFTFQTPQTISCALFLALIIGATIVIRVLAQVERDAILSRMSGTEGGELGKDFYIRVLAYGALPVLTVLGTQFPSLARFISTWAQPTIAAVH